MESKVNLEYLKRLKIKGKKWFAQNKKKIAVLMGGNSNEREISLATGKSVYDVLKNFVNKDNLLCLDLLDRKNYELLLDNSIAVAFNMIHGELGEDGSIQGFLDSINCLHTGGSVFSSAITFNKKITKNYLSYLCKELYLAKDYEFILNENEKLNYDEIFKISDKVVIKEVSGGSSLDLFIAYKNNKDSLINFVGDGKKVWLAEEFIEGQELTVTMLGNSYIGALAFNNDREIFDYEAKYQHIGVSINSYYDENLKDLSIKVTNALKIENLVRLDWIKSKKDHKYYFLELNTIPGLTKASLVPMCFKNINFDFSDLVAIMLAKSLEVKDH